MKKFFSLLIVSSLLFLTGCGDLGGIVPGADTITGESGPLSWGLTATGVLNIGGTGAMPDYTPSGSASNAPWSEYSSKIKTIRVGYGVTGIGAGAFVGLPSLENVYVPETLKSVGARAFADCGALSFIALPEGTTVGEGAFDGCDSLKGDIFDPVVLSGKTGSTDWTLTIHGVLTLSGRGPMTDNRPVVFDVHDDITVVVIEEGITSIGNFSFAGCSKLTEISIPESVRSIGDYAFGGCAALASIGIPGGVEDIGNKAFRDCTGLAEATLGPNVRTIGDEAFKNCAGLASITFNNESRFSLGLDAFAECPSLASVTLASPTPPTIYELTYTTDSGTFTISDTTSFTDNTTDTLHVPRDGYDAYLSDEKWASRFSRIEAY